MGNFNFSEFNNALVPTADRFKHDNYLCLGEAEGLDGEAMFGLPKSHREYHVYIAGQTGTGKSRLLESMICQDIGSWVDNQRGLVVLDPHGSLCDGVMQYLASKGPRWRERLTQKRGGLPIVNLDFHSRDIVPIYNPLRHRPNTNTSVVIDGLIAGILHGWGIPNDDQTPLLSRWLRNILTPLYLGGRPITDASRLLTDASFRQEMLKPITGLMLDNWQERDRKPVGKQNDDLSSTLSKLTPMLESNALQQILGPGPSFDFEAAMEEGQIVLVNMSKAGGVLSEKDQKILSALLFADLWQTAQSRAEKRSNPKPFYVYADEFQKMVSPSIAEGFAEARGFGLHMTVAHQFPSQLLKDGDIGKAVLNSVLANAWTHISFRQTLPEDVDLLTSVMFGDMPDPDQIQHELYKTTVVGQKVEYLQTRSQSVGETDSWSETETDNWSSTASHGGSTNWSDTVGSSDATSLNQGTTHASADATSQNQGISNGSSDTKSKSQSIADGVSDNWNQSRGVNTNESQGTSQSESRSTMQLIKPSDLQQYFSAGTIGNDGNRPKGKGSQSQMVGFNLGQTMTSGHSSGTSENQGSGGGSSHVATQSSGDARTNSQSTSSGTGRTHSDSVSASQGSGSTHTDSSSSTVGGSTNWSVSETVGGSFASTVGGSTTVTETVGEVPVLFSVYDQELSSVTFRSISDQLYIASQVIRQQAPRCFVARIKGVPTPIIARTLDVPDHFFVDRALQKLVADFADQRDFLVSVTDLPKHVIEDPKDHDDEPESYRVKQ